MPKSRRGGTQLAQTGDNVATDFIEDENGNIISGDTAKNIRERMRAVFQEMRNPGSVYSLPLTWKQAGVTERKYVFQEMYGHYPYLRNCDDDWKVLYLASTVLSSFHGTLKRQEKKKTKAMSSKEQPDSILDGNNATESSTPNVVTTDNAVDANAASSTTTAGSKRKATGPSHKPAKRSRTTHNEPSSPSTSSSSMLPTAQIGAIPTTASDPVPMDLTVETKEISAMTTAATTSSSTTTTSPIAATTAMPSTRLKPCPLRSTPKDPTPVMLEQPVENAPPAQPGNDDQEATKDVSEKGPAAVPETQDAHIKDAPAMLERLRQAALGAQPSNDDQGATQDILEKGPAAELEVRDAHAKDTVELVNPLYVVCFRLPFLIPASRTFSESLFGPPSGPSMRIDALRSLRGKYFFVRSSFWVIYTCFNPSTFRGKGKGTRWGCKCRQV